MSFRSNKFANERIGIFVEPIGTQNIPVGRAVLSYDYSAPTPSLNLLPGNFTRFPEEKLRHRPAPGEQPITAGLESEEINWLNVTIGLVTNSSFFNVNVTSKDGVVSGTFFAPTVPALLQVIHGARDPGDFIPSENLIRLKKNKLYHVKFEKGGITHPIHLHGHTFEVLKSAGSQEVISENAVRKDVVAINEETIIRFRTDNPGPWFLHCHIDWHLEAGLAVIFGEALEESGPQKDYEGTQVINQDWEALCPAYNDLSPGQ
jgi:FtsP/CotA-like multicopper oxidase with cupredoxin domain